MEKREHRYHHGDLRRALLDAALQLADERGIHNFTLREVARRAGVSHNAPYHHFVDKAALVEALVLESFEEMNKVLRQAYDSTPGMPLNKILATGVAYVQFALEHRSAFRFMFRPELHLTAHPEHGRANAVEEAGETAFQVLLNAIREAQQADQIILEDIELLALTTWSTTHGLALLLIDGSIKRIPQSSQEIEQLTQQVVQVLSEGLKKR